MVWDPGTQGPRDPGVTQVEKVPGPLRKGRKPWRGMVKELDYILNSWRMVINLLTGVETIFIYPLCLDSQYGYLYTRLLTIAHRAFDFV